MKTQLLDIPVRLPKPLNELIQDAIVKYPWLEKKSPERQNGMALQDCISQSLKDNLVFEKILDICEELLKDRAIGDILTEIGYFDIKVGVNSKYDAFTVTLYDEKLDCSKFKNSKNLTGYIGCSLTDNEGLRIRAIVLKEDFSSVRGSIMVGKDGNYFLVPFNRIADFLINESKNEKTY